MPTLRQITAPTPLVVAFVVLTLLAIGPLTSVDAFLHRHWVQDFTPELYPFFKVLDSIAGQAVALPVLLAVALPLALAARSWRPLVLVGLVEAAFFGGVGGLKVLFARPAASRGDPVFFNGGIDDMGLHGISYPSGHASEAVLLYGMAVYLLCTQLPVKREMRRALVVVWGGIIALAVSVSYALGFHWVTDLIGGVIAGGLMLHGIIWLDRWHAVRRLTRDPGTPRPGRREPPVRVLAWPAGLDAVNRRQRAERLSGGAGRTPAARG